jgi:hypothetical protein
MSVDPDVWDSLTDRFPPPPRGRRIPVYWPWAAAGVAAVLLVWALLLNPFSDERTVEVAQESLENSMESKPDVSVGESAITHTRRQAKQPLLTHHSQPQKQTRKTAVVSEIISDDAENRRDKESYLPQIVSEEITQLTVTEEPIGTVVPVEPAEPIETAELVGTATPGTNVIPVGESEEQRKQRSLIAALGSGGALLDISFGRYDADNPIYDSPFPGGDFNNGGGLGSGDKYNLLTPNDYTDIEHRLPVSFSLTADFPVGKKVSLETGLSYTYLFSRFRRNDHFIYRGTLQQHYIGIPVNLRYTVWQNEAWNVYISGGGSIEKGLRSVYKQEIEGNGSVIQHTNVYSRIDGFQFSAQGGAGFSYRLQNNLNLFGEPKLIYYFKNNQPMSARTENPLIFGLNMGIRIQFNVNN